MSATTEARAPSDAAATSTYTASCFCGTVKLKLTGEPVGMGYCHCESCRTWSASPVNAFTLWKPENVRVVQGENEVLVYNKTPISDRKWCRKCGGHLMANHPTLGVVDVYAGVIPGLAFKPGVHVNYQETKLPMRDSLPKFKDMPKEMGGSGTTLPE